MRTPTVTFARPARLDGTDEPIEFAGHREAEAELGDWLHWPDPRTGPAKQMSADSFLAWLLAHHTNLERNILVAGLLRDLRKAERGRLTLFLKTAKPPALRVDLRVGRISAASLKILRRHAKARSLEVKPIVDVPTGTQGAGCFVGSEIVGVFAAHDMTVILER